MNSNTEAAFPAFQRCLSMPEVGALGKVGMEYTADPSMWSKQHAVLDRVLEHLQHSHVLVLHARGMMSGQPGGTYLQLLYQLKGVVPQEQKIHLHCFEGNLDTMNQWQRVFPNTHFGFTGLVQHFNNDSKEALKQLQEKKQLLEMDDILHLRETNVRQKIAQLIFSLHRDIVFCQVVIPYKGQFKDLEYTIKCEILHLVKKKANRQSQFVMIV